MEEFESIEIKKATNGYIVEHHQDGSVHIFKKDNEVLKYIKHLLSRDATGDAE